MSEKSSRGQDAASGKITAPHVVVKFRPELELPYIDNLEEYIVANELAPWQKLADEFPGITLRRIYISIAPERVQELEDRAFRETPTRRRPHLLKFFRVDAPPGTDRHAVARAIGEWDITELAYVPLRINYSPDLPVHVHSFLANEEHLDVAPQGVGAKAAWQTPGADGSGVAFIDIERGWVLDHQNFLVDPAVSSSSVFTVADPGDSDISTDPDDMAHGSSVLGIVAAPDHMGAEFKILGTAFKAAGSVVSSIRFLSGGGTDPDNVHDAIMTATGLLEDGDVLLIEAQAQDDPPIERLWPVEVNYLEYLEIQTAAGNNIAVIEPAGNGLETSPVGADGNDLDAYTDAVGNHILDRNSSEFNPDSGAIVVGSATSATPHSPMQKTDYHSESNYGSRVDCYCWGEWIWTTGGPGVDNYDSGFGGTSGASAIIAGVALIAQGLAKANNLGTNTNGTYNSEEIRRILGSFDPMTDQPWRRPPPDDDPPYGTKSSDPVIDLIGVMPDLIKIVDEKMGLGPDVFMRDNLTDDGSEPQAGSISASPDIIVRNTEVLGDPDGNDEFGQGTPNQNLGGLGEPVINDGSGSDKYVYVRVTNRGSTPAGNVQITVYWSEVATLVTPPWNLVASSSIPDIPPAEMRVAKVVWEDTASSIPTSGHYCFVGVIETDRDTAPEIPSSFASFEEYRGLIRDSNNVTWCNFNVVETSASALRLLPRAVGEVPEPNGADDSGDRNNERIIYLPFLVTGAQFADLPMQLTVDARLAADARIWLEGPAKFLDEMGAHPVSLPDAEKRRIGRAKLDPRGLRTFETVNFPSKLRERMRLVIDLPEQARNQSYEAHIRQSYEGEALGGIVWRLAPPKRKRRRSLKEWIRAIFRKR